MADKEIKCPCYIDRPLHRYDKGCLIQSQVFYEQQTQEKPILRCDEIENCPIKEHFKQLKRAEQKLEMIKYIATDLLSLTNEYDNCYHKDNCRKCDKVCQYRFVDKILQIIEGEENE